MHEIQIAMGPTYELTDSEFRFTAEDFSILWMVHSISKAVQLQTGLPQFRYDLDSSYDIDQVSELGVYIGARIKTANDISYSIEYQHTNSADAIAMRLLWKF